MDQAREVSGIQAVYRFKFASKHQEYNCEARALRRTNIAKESKQRLLTSEQRKKFEEYKRRRKEMASSSRDDKDL